MGRKVRPGHLRAQIAKHPLNSKRGRKAGTSSCRPRDQGPNKLKVIQATGQPNEWGSIRLSPLCAQPLDHSDTPRHGTQPPCHAAFERCVDSVPTADQPYACNARQWPLLARPLRGYLSTTPPRALCVPIEMPNSKSLLLVSSMTSRTAAGGQGRLRQAPAPLRTCPIT